MHDCPHCGTTLNARPSYCDKTTPTYTNAGFSTVLFVAFGGIAIAAILFFGRAIIG